jgi:predicted small metal-binding protein
VVKNTQVSDIKSLRCPCGFEVRSRDEDEIVRMARDHAKTIHGQELTVEQAQALIQAVA